MTMAWVAITALARTVGVGGRGPGSARTTCKRSSRVLVSLPEQSAVPMRRVGAARHAIGTECAYADPGDAGIEVKPSVRIPKVGGPAGAPGWDSQPASRR